MGRILTVTLNPALDVSTETAKVEHGRKLRCAAPRVDPGGGGVNVSRAAAFLGGATVPLLAAGGPTGARLLALLRAEGLHPVDLGVAAETRESFSVVETGTGRQFRFVTPGPQWGAADVARARAAILDAVAPGDLIVASGSQPRGLPDGFFPDLAAGARALGAETLLDTSGGPLRAAATAGARLAALRMDEVEAEALAGRALPDPAALASFAAALRDAGAARIVAIGAGALGTIVAHPGGAAHCRPPHVAVVSKTGAGDSFVAAFALRLMAGDDAVSACAWGVAAAAAAVTTPDTRLCDRATVERLRPAVACAPLDAHPG
jgi:6-phosphofructokinase 2